MHTFGLWYFDTGWIIATVVGCLVGPVTTYTKRPGRNLALWCAGILVVGAVAIYGKYKC